MPNDEQKKLLGDINTSLAKIKTNVTPEVSAKTLAEGVNKVTVPQPKVAEPDKYGSKLVSNISRDLNGFITAQTKEAEDLKKAQREYAGLLGGESLSDLYNQTQKDYGVNQDTFGELKDINLQLADMDTESLGTQSDIARAAGQTLGQGSREISAEQARNSVRSYGLAARAAVLQGNINTAQAAAERAVNIAYQDRQLYSENMIKQIEWLQGQVDEQTAALYEQEKRNYEAKLAATEELKTNIANAMVNGASQQEIARLTSDQLDDAQKLQLAQSIVARGATEMRGLDIRSKEASIAASQASAFASSVSAQKTQKEIAAMDKIETGSNNIAIQALDAFSGTLNENNREQFTSALTGAINRGDVDNTEIALKNAAQAASGKAMTEDVIKRDQAINALKDVQDALSAYENAGGETNLLVGGYEDLQNRLGKTTDTKLADIETRIQLALNSYTNAVSGASFTPQESARYAALFPSTSNENVLNEQKISTLVDTFESNNQVFYGNYYGGYTPRQLAEESVYQELIANASPEQLQELGITQ